MISKWERRILEFQNLNISVEDHSPAYFAEMIRSIFMKENLTVNGDSQH